MAEVQKLLLGPTALRSALEKIIAARRQRLLKECAEASRHPRRPDAAQAAAEREEELRILMLTIENEVERQLSSAGPTGE